MFLQTLVPQGENGQFEFPWGTIPEKSSSIELEELDSIVTLRLDFGVTNPGPPRQSNDPQRGVFATTHWSVVLAAAGDADCGDSHKALAALCEAYWYPIYVYVRRKGHGPEDAEDLTQEFFAQLITKEHLRQADPDKGKFRSFLLAVLDHFLAREWSRAHRQKRGGQFKMLSLDGMTPEQRYRVEPADNDTPEKKFLQQWAVTVLKHAMQALERECAAEGKASLFQAVKGFLSVETESAPYASISNHLGISEGAVRVAVHRLRQRYGELLREQIARTVTNAEAVDEELDCLIQALGD